MKDKVDWPMPFGGLTVSIQIPSQSDFLACVSYLAQCHDGNHNFAVQGDGNTIHTTPLGRECLLEFKHHMNY